MSVPVRPAALAAAFALGWLAGCSQGSVDSAVNTPASIQVGTQLADPQILTRSLDDEPRSLDPLLSSDVPGQRVLDDLYEGLTTVGVDGRASPGVAASWEQSADGLTWTFHLRPQARWSNGAPVTAGDFVFAWRRVVDPHTGAPYAQGLGPIRNALKVASGEASPDRLGVSALDAHTLRVQLEGPTPFLLDLLSQTYSYPEYPPVVMRYGDSWTSIGHIVSNGAFRLAERVIGNRLILDRNPFYWDAAHVRLKRVVYYVLPDRNVEVQRFLAGEVEWVDSFPPDQFDYLRSRLGSQVVLDTYFGTYMLTFNFDLPPFRDNWPLREALVLAIDREQLVRAMNPIYQPAYTLMPPLAGYAQPLPAWARLSTEARHTLARALYRRAGYSDSDPLRVDIDSSIQGTADRHFYEAVAASWHAIRGADVHVNEREFKVLLQERELHKLPLAHGAWIGDYPDPYTFMQIFMRGDGNNGGDYANAAFDALIAQAGQQQDDAHRYPLFEQAERVLNEDAVYVPLYYYATRHLVKPYVRGWQGNIMDRDLSRYMYVLEHAGH